MAATFTVKNFDQEVIRHKGPVLVDFWATWCGPCRMLGPIIDELAAELDGGDIKIGKVNVDEEQSLAQQFGIMSIPTIIIFNNGAAVEQMVGVQTKEVLKEKLQKLAAA
jgi:thioredoxin 1